jgi:hypothetical protein
MVTTTAATHDYPGHHHSHSHDRHHSHSHDHQHHRDAPSRDSPSASHFLLLPEPASAASGAMREAELQRHGWMVPTAIDDGDLTFGGKSLSAWYEEERGLASMACEEERRGRQRVSSAPTPREPRARAEAD